MKNIDNNAEKKETKKKGWSWIHILVASVTMIAGLLLTGTIGYGIIARIIEFFG